MKYGASATMNIANSAARAAYITNGYYVAATFGNMFPNGDMLFLPPVCTLTNPGACPSGLTVALWARVDSVPIVGGGPVVLANSGPPSFAGMSLHLLAGSYAMSSLSALLKVQAVVDTGTQTWTASVELEPSLLIGAYHNYAVSWSPNYGIFIFIDGNIVGVCRFDANQSCQYFNMGLILRTIT